jgi:hypothetical protein
MKEVIFVIEEDIESGYNAYALGASIVTQGETITRCSSFLQPMQSTFLTQVFTERSRRVRRE